MFRVHFSREGSRRSPSSLEVKKPCHLGSLFLQLSGSGGAGGRCTSDMHLRVLKKHPQVNTSRETMLREESGPAELASPGPVLAVGPLGTLYAGCLLGPKNHIKCLF